MCHSSGQPWTSSLFPIRLTGLRFLCRWRLLVERWVNVAFLFVNTTFSFSSQCWQFVASLIRLRAISIMACATDIIWSMLPALMASKSFPSASCNRTPEAPRAFRCSVSATVISPSCFCNCSVSSLLNLPRFHFDLTKKSFIFRSLYGFI